MRLILTYYVVAWRVQFVDHKFWTPPYGGFGQISGRISTYMLHGKNPSGYGDSSPGFTRVVTSRTRN